MKSYKGLVFKYIKQQKKNVIPIYLSMILTITLLTTIVFISTNVMQNNFAKEKLSFGDYDVRFQNLDKDKVDVLKTDNNVKDYALAKASEVIALTIKPQGFDFITYMDLYAVEDKVLSDYMGFRVVSGTLPKNDNEVVISKSLMDKIGDELTVGKTIELEVRETPGVITDDYFIKLRELSYKVDEPKTLDAIDWHELDREVQAEIEKENGPINTRKVKYTISGIIETDSKDTLFDYKVIRVLSNEELQSMSGKFEAFTYLKDISKIQEMSNKLDLKYTNQILKMNQYGSRGSEVKYPAYNKESYSSILKNSLAIEVIILAILFSLMALYNTFHASVSNRIKFYGIIRAIGGSMSQITYLIFSEALILYIASIPIGLILGFSLINLESWILVDKLQLMKSFSINITLEVTLTILLSTLVIILISVISALRKEGKLTPIEAILNARGIKVKTVKVKNLLGQSINTNGDGSVDAKETKEILEYEKTTLSYKIIKKIFRFEGELAHKNITRDARIHKLTKATLFIAMSVLIFFFSQVINGTIQMKQLRNNKLWDVCITSNNGIIKSDEIDNIKSMKGIKNLYTVDKEKVSVVVDKSYISDELLNSLINLEDTKEGDKQNQYGIPAAIMTLDDNSIKLYPGIDKNALDAGGVLLVDKGVSYVLSKVGQNGEIENAIFYRSNPSLKLEAGEKITITTSTDVLTQEGLKEYTKNNDVYTTLNIVGNVEDDKLSSIYNSTNKNEIDRNVTLLTTEKGLNNILPGVNNKKLLIEIDSNFDRKEVIKNINEIVGRNNYQLQDTIGSQRDLEINIKENLGLNIIFAVTMILLVILNLINTMNASIISREKDLAGMRAIGMSSKQEMKMIIAEVFNISLFAALTTILTFGIISIAFQGQNISANLIKPSTIVLGDLIIILTLMIISNLTVIAPLQLIKKSSIVESLKKD